MVVARPAREIHDTRLPSDPVALPSCTLPSVSLAWYRAHGHGYALPPCVRIDVVRVFPNLGARDESVPWKCVRNIHASFKRPL